jgi:hypothetical protein
MTSFAQEQGSWESVCPTLGDYSIKGHILSILVGRFAWKILPESWKTKGH